MAEKNKARGLAKNLAKPMGKQRFGPEEGGQLKNKSYGLAKTLKSIGKTSIWAGAPNG